MLSAVLTSAVCWLAALDGSRSAVIWFSDPLICKSFGIEEPWPSGQGGITKFERSENCRSTVSIWQVGQKKAITFQVCTEPKRCILFLIYSFLKAKSTIWRFWLVTLNFRKPTNALFAIYHVGNSFTLDSYFFPYRF